MKCIFSALFSVTILSFSIFMATRPMAFSTTLSPSYTLLGAGAKWAANGGTEAVYVDFYDNLIAHPNPNWPSDATSYLHTKNEVMSVLEGEGFTVDTVADIPSNLSQYSLVYLEAYFACEPANEPEIRSYVSNGGGLYVCQAAISFLAYYGKTTNTPQDLSEVEAWFGASYFDNTGGTAYASEDNPLGTSLKAGDTIVAIHLFSFIGMTSMSADSQVVAVWDDSSTFAFTHEYGQGRVYWQAAQSPEPSPSPSNALSLTLHGSFDYGVTEQARVKVFAELRDSVTMKPISGANVTIQVFDPNHNLWASASMVETQDGTGIYEWETADTVANMNPQMGVYLARVTASTEDASASEITAFHIDPPASIASPADHVENTGLQLLLAALAIALCVALTITVLLRRTSKPRRSTFAETKTTGTLIAIAKAIHGLRISCPYYGH